MGPGALVRRRNSLVHGKVEGYWHEKSNSSSIFPACHGELRRSQPAAPVDAMSPVDLLGTMFPNPCFIWLTRRDKLRQAISTVNAVRTGVWHSSQLSARMSQAPELPYSLETMDRAIGLDALVENRQ
jgi:hypothetical protein